MDSRKNIPISNIYYMLTYAFQVLRQKNYEEIEGEPFEHIYDLLAAILNKGIAQLLKQGLHREYINRTEDLPVLHGKVEINGTFRNLLQRKKRLTCEYDELSENNIFNQILKTTIIRLLRQPSVKAETKAALKKERLFFASIDEIDPSLIRWDMLRFDRNNQTYRMLLNICQFALESLLLSEKAGKSKLAQFEEEWLCRLYEKFILEFYRTEVKAIHASASPINWQVKGEKTALLPAMQSDIMLTQRGGRTLIIDAKFYSKATREHMGKRILHSQNIYQIFTYVMNQDVGNTRKVAGMLLYAKTDEEIPPELDAEIMGHRIMAGTLDLSGDFASIKEQLIGIARDYFELPA